MDKHDDPLIQTLPEQPFASADERWVNLIGQARDWFAEPLGQLLLQSQRRLLEEELARLFGSYMVYYGPVSGALPQAPQIRHSLRLGAPYTGVDIVCDEQFWPVAEHAADAVVLHHALDFSISPHDLLREAARSVRPGGHILVLGINPFSSWGVRHFFCRDALRKAHCIAPGRVTDWLRLLGFSLEKRHFGCYRPPLRCPVWQQRFAAVERLGSCWQLPVGGFYFLMARKLSMGMRPVRETNKPNVGQMIPMPVAKVSRCKPITTPTN